MAASLANRAAARQVFRALQHRLTGIASRFLKIAPEDALVLVAPLMSLMLLAAAGDQAAPSSPPPEAAPASVAAPADPAPDADAPSPPHLAGEHELGGPAVQADWWRTDRSAFDPGDGVPGFVGGVEIPDLLKPPPRRNEQAGKEQSEQSGKKPVTGEDTATPAPTPPARRRFPLPVPLPGTGWTNPLLLLAAAALVAGAVLGNWFALVLGWLIAYGSRRLTPMETKWAVLVLPGLALTAVDQQGGAAPNRDSSPKISQLPRPPADGSPTIAARSRVVTTERGCARRLRDGPRRGV